MASSQQRLTDVKRLEVVKFFVNGEKLEHEFEKPPERKPFSLTVREIFESAGFTPVEEWQLTRDEDNHTFFTLDDDVMLQEGEQFTATFEGATTASRETPIDESDTHSGDLIFGEGQLVLSDGVIVQTHFVQLNGAQAFNWPTESPALTRGCRAEHAIEIGARLRLSKPEAFRHADETLIGDLGEGVTRKEEQRVNRVAVNAPDDMQLAHQLDAEYNALARAIGSRQRKNTTGTRTKSTTTNRNTNTYGKSGWILCTSIRPSDETELQHWSDSLDAAYDHVTTIQSPRDFARALARMVVSQLGPRGGPVTYTHPLSKQKTIHPGQSVFHGPVAYVDDPYAYVASAANPFEVMLRSAFFKHTRFRNQREYRFVVWCENEPDDPIVYLAVSRDMLGALSLPEEQTPDLLSTQSDGQSAHTNVLADNEDGGEKLSSPSNTPTGPSDREEPEPDADREGESDPAYGYEQDRVVVPIPIAVAMQTAEVQPRLRQLVLDADTDPQAAAAAFHATFPLEALIATFVDPVSNVEWRDGGLIITFNMPSGSDKEGQLALGAHGTGQYRIGTADEYTEVRCDRGWMLVQNLVTDLQQQGLVLWSQLPDEALMIRPSEPSAESETRVRSSYSAEILRTIKRKIDTVDEAEIDRINAQEPRCADDARISKVVVDGGPGHIVKMHGIRDGLSGVITHRAKVDSVTITVETINPDASVEVHAPDARLEADGHRVALAEGEDTSIKIIATAPDGMSTSHLDILLKRSPEPDEEERTSE